jgi:Zn-dependent alcohol dehydrogenase
MRPDLAARLDAHPDVKAVPGTDLYVVATRPLATDAAMVQGCLVASGVPAVLGDANLVQAYAGAVMGLGGVRVLVPQRYLQQALEALAAYERGEFALDDEVDVGVENDTSDNSSR